MGEELRDDQWVLNQGVWEKIRLTFLGTLDHQAKLDWDAAFLDGSFVPGQKGAIDYGWKGKGSTVPPVTEGNGIPLAYLVTAANVPEVTVGLEVVDRVKVPRPQGRPRQRPASLAADKSYDSADFRWGLRKRRIRSSIPQRKWKGRHRKPGRPPLVHQVSRGRWKVERSHGWLDNWRRLVTRYDWYTESYVAFLTIACFMVTLARILQ